MMERFDIVVFGATGFTGGYAAKNLALLIKNVYTDLKWAISGRSREKMKNLMAELAAMGVNTSEVEMIQSDVTDEESLANMTRKAKVLMNCTGPYATLGEPVVRACIQTGTHYLDITAELHFMLKTFRSYNKAAEDANVLVITACGFGSIPGVMGLMHLEKQFKGTLKMVECYATIDIPKRAYLPGPSKCLLHYGTWASLVYELRNFKEYSQMKKETFPYPIKYETSPEEMNKSFFHRHQGRFWFPYPGPDHDIVEMSQRYLSEKRGKKPVPFKIYTTMPLLFHFFFVVPAFFAYYYLCYFKCFRNLLWRYPGFFTFGYVSHKGPSKEMAADTKYSFTLTGKGSKEGNLNSNSDSSVTLKVSGLDPGYQTTGMIFALAAITLIKDQSKMPKGGVVSTGAAFWDTEFVNRLNSNGVKFEFQKS